MKITRMLRPVLTALLTLSAAHPALAMSNEQASRRAAYELVECAAYYLSGSIAFEKQGYAKEANQFEGLSRYALELARATLPRSTVQSRLATAQEANDELLRSGSISALLAKYGDLCKTALENPGARMSYWRDQDE